MSEGTLINLRENYTVYHLHSDYSSPITNIDSATKIDQYIARARELGMSSLAFSEHGCILNWYEKKSKIEKAGMKYIHAAEFYVTETLKDKVRDNYHFVLIAKNYEGFKELNKLVSISFNRKDNHYYYAPRISIEELFNTSDNIIVTTACLGNLLYKWSPKYLQGVIMADKVDTDMPSPSATSQINQPINMKKKLIDWMCLNSHRCFLEIQHHNVDAQREYNRELVKIHQETGIRLIAGTDTHSLDEEYAEARIVLQKAKGIFFEDEEGWDMTFKSYRELVEAYEIQGSIPMEYVYNAIDNTNVMADMIEPFEIDMSTKYPKLYENSTEVFRNMVYAAIDKHPYALQYHTREEIIDRVEEELPVYEATGMIDFMLFQQMVREWEHENNIFTGPSRGSCFTEDALVTCDTGLKKIIDVTVGDHVLSLDKRYHVVYETTSYSVNEDVIEFTYDGQPSEYKNICTTDHRILIKFPDRLQYVTAENIKVGDLLCFPRGKEIVYVRVTSTKRYHYEGKVYDLSVKTSHNYVINNFIVHNCSGSYIAYLLRITEMDSIRFDLNFFRFANKDRVSNAD